MNSQTFFAKEEKREGLSTLSTPKFHRNLSNISFEKEENTLDILQPNINILINIESKSNINEQINNEFQNNSINNNFALKSILNEINNKNELNDYQFSFDGKIKNIDNNIINIDNKTDIENDNNNEIKYISNEDSNRINSNSKYNENDENFDNNFNYNLPLESDKSSENFNLISFQAFSKEIDEKKNEKIKKIPNQKKINFERKLYNNPKIINKKRNIGYLSKQKNNSKEIIIKDNIQLTPEKENKNRNNNSLNKSDKISKSNFNSIKKNNFILEIPSLIYKNDKCLNEPNNQFFEFNNININNSLENTDFNSKKKKSIFSLKRENNDINPFIIKKISFNNNTNKIKKDELKNNKIKKINISYYKKRNLKLKKSINSKKRNTFIEDNNNIYDKNIISNKDIIFPYNKKERNNLIHSRNYNQLNNQNFNFTYDNSSLSKKKQKSIFLLSKNNLNKSPFQNRKISYRKFSMSGLDNSSNGLLKKIKHEKIHSLINKLKNLDKNSISKKIIFNNQSSSVENRNIKIKLNKKEKYEINDTFISSNEIKNNHKFTIFCNYDSKRPKNIFGNKEKNINLEINKIRVNTTNGETKYSHKNINFMNYKSNHPNKLIVEKRRINAKIIKNSIRESSNIYSKKFNFNNNNDSNSNSNLFSTINNEKKANNIIRNKIIRRNINKSLILNKGKNIFITDKNSNNNSLIIKDKNKFREIFNNIISNIDLNKNINNNKKKTINNFKKIKILNETYNVLNSNTENIYSRENNILSNYKINSFKSKIKFQNKITKKPKINKYYNTINNNINIGCNEKFRKNPKISKTKEKREKLLNTLKIKSNIGNYILSNNKNNNKIRNKISIYFEENNNNKDEDLEICSGDEYIKNKKEKSLIKDNDLKEVNNNRKIIINVNQFYPKFFIN